jgi:ribosomal protein S25
MVSAQKVSSDTIFRFIIDKTLEEHRFCSVKEVADQFRMGRIAGRKMLNSLVKEEKLTIVYQNSKMKVYAPKEIIEQIAHTVKKPEWIENYELPDKKKYKDEQKELAKALNEFERFEELLYLKNDPLEETTIFTFRWLGFKVTPTSPKGSYADFEIEKDGYLGAVEVSGGNGGCPMTEVRQLRHYHDDQVEKGRHIPNLLLLFNHYCDKDVKERKPAFAPNVIDAAKTFEIMLATTYQLYGKIRQAKSGKKTKEVVAREFMSGIWEVV